MQKLRETFQGKGGSKKSYNQFKVACIHDIKNLTWIEVGPTFQKNVSCCNLYSILPI